MELYGIKNAIKYNMGINEILVKSVLHTVLPIQVKARYCFLGPAFGIE